MLFGLDDDERRDAGDEMKPLRIATRGSELALAQAR